ncbi:uncharacterized protein [Symphalangus syndactylus]|uniref:uncharacterized protein isoform X6 n=1 Tax=Symphalangus syndactylus TaxID=9590 RepID=UPI003007C5BB
MTKWFYTIIEKAVACLFTSCVLFKKYLLSQDNTNKVDLRIGVPGLEPCRHASDVSSGEDTGKDSKEQENTLASPIAFKVLSKFLNPVHESREILGCLMAAILFLKQFEFSKPSLKIWSHTVKFKYMLCYLKLA